MRPPKPPASPHNPFSPGPGYIPPYLAGREAEQDRLSTEVARLQDVGMGRMLLMYGPRGMGKTTLLEWLEGHCKERRIETITGTANEILGSMTKLSKAVLPKSRLLVEWAMNLDIHGVFSTGLKTSPEDRYADTPLSKHLTIRCRRKPLVLLVDEAHAAPDKKVLGALLNAGQVAAARTPFLLVLAGTPEVEEVLEGADVTFIERADRLGIGLLDEEAAAAAVYRPMEEAGITMSEDARNRIVEDSQCYPYFLQAWGKALWDFASRRGALQHGESRQIDLDDVMQVDPDVQAIKTAFYDRRYRALNRESDLLAAAGAVAQAIGGGAELDEVPLQRVIEKTLKSTAQDFPQPPDRREIEKRAWELLDELVRTDFVWRRPRTPHMEPGIPSFITYLQQRVSGSCGNRRTSSD